MKWESDHVNDTHTDGDLASENGSVCSATDEKVLAHKETKAVNILRAVTFFVLLLATATVSLLVFFYGRDKENDEFLKQFGYNAGKVVDSFQVNAEKRLSALEGFATMITSHALFANETFPMVTLPDFERKASYTLQLAQVISILIFPIVSRENRATWERYSVENQRWLEEGLALQKIVKDGDEEEALMQLEEQVVAGNLDVDPFAHLNIPPFIFKVEEGGTAAAYETGPGPYAPVWQLAPAIPAAFFVNFNGLSHPSRKLEINTVLRTEKRLVSAAADFSNDNDPNSAGRKAVLNLFLNRWKSGGNDYDEGPVSDIIIPVFTSFGENKTVGALLNSYIYWQVYLTDILTDEAEGIVCVLENSCSQSFTYRIDGKDATYIGQGDLHDPSYNGMMVETGFGAVVGNNNVDFSIHEHCYYNLRVYPSKETEDKYITFQPIMFALILVAVFVFTSFVFVTYDCLVQHRNSVVNTSAIQSSSVVSSLFPEQVRNRLHKVYKSEKSKQHNHTDIFKSITSDGKSRDDFEAADLNEFDDSTPIADLYPNCTVLFADIAGFTAWSSERAPTEVFKLLETLYGAFDKIAKKYKVFKVETIGDCYVAVTGLPTPQDAHAVAMCRFSSSCNTKMNQMMHILVEKLGPDTANLSMRFGLHSGPVTAGVLRGEKARFQLFGDTVNTAARMESTGQKGRIHISKATAALIQKAGKGSWMKIREELVEAKGKGMMQTYWVEPPDFGTTSTGISSNHDVEDASESQHLRFTANEFKNSKIDAMRFKELMDSLRYAESATTGDLNAALPQANTSSEKD
jgi:class 3 adenylate cyclase